MYQHCYAQYCYLNALRVFNLKIAALQCTLKAKAR